MITRKHFRGCILNEESSWQQALEKDKDIVKLAIQDKKCMTVALYKHMDMLFLYYEALDESLDAAALFPELSKHLALWPQMSGHKAWAKMYHIYYHAIPKEEKWERKGKKIRRGRIAHLYEDKLFSYVYYHKAIVDEGLLEGDMYQSIALHEDLLFSYFEEPKQFTHIRAEVNEPSRVIDEWLAVDPESHFDHDFTGGENFVFVEEVFSMGREDL